MLRGPTRKLTTWLLSTMYRGERGQIQLLPLYCPNTFFNDCRFAFALANLTSCLSYNITSHMDTVLFILFLMLCKWFCLISEPVYDQDTLSVIFPSIYANSEHRNMQVPQNLEERKRQSKYRSVCKWVLGQNCNWNCWERWRCKEPP